MLCIVIKVNPAVHVRNFVQSHYKNICLFVEVPCREEPSKATG